MTRAAFTLLTVIAGFLLVPGHESLGGRFPHKEEGWQAYGSGAFERAEDLWSKDLESAKASGDSSLIAEAQYRLAHVHAARTEHGKAIELLQQSMDLVDADDPVFMLSAQKLVSTLESAGRDEDTEKLLRALISLRERSELHTDLTLRLRLAEVYRRSGRTTLAEKIHREALADAVRQSGRLYMNIHLGLHFDALADLYEADGRDSEAADVQREKIKLMKQLPGEASRVEDELWELVRLLRQAGRSEEAAQAQAEAARAPIRQ